MKEYQEIEEACDDEGLRLKYVPIGFAVLVLGLAVIALIAVAIGYAFPPPDVFQPADKISNFARLAIWGSAVMIKGAAAIVVAAIVSFILLMLSHYIGLEVVTFVRERSRKHEAEGSESEKGEQ